MARWRGGAGVTVSKGINASGEVTGYSGVLASPFYHAFLFINGHMQDLGALPGLDSSEGYSINSAGQVTGTSYLNDYGPQIAFLYSNGHMQGLVTSGGGPVNGIGNGINDASEVTGYYYTGAPTFRSGAFLYSNGQLTDLGTLPGYSSSLGTGINNAGQVTGFSSGIANTDHSHAFLYSNGRMNDLGTLGGPSSYGRAINNNGQITGNAETLNGTFHAFLYDEGAMIDLGTLNGAFSSFGYGINNLAQIVGSAGFSSGSSRAFIYSDGIMTDLNSKLVNSIDSTLTEARGINDSGQIVVNGSHNVNGISFPDAFLLTPVTVPEPSTLTLVGGAAALLLLRCKASPTCSARVPRRFT